ncbi:MAG: hypothetical protein Q4B68_08035, partial [Bacteroidales bacterium]|nr:hypothetical protein [Bacteroidales bacterium]
GEPLARSNLFGQMPATGRAKFASRRDATTLWMLFDFTSYILVNVRIDGVVAFRLECILMVHRVQAFRSGAASFRFAPFRSASAAYLPTHIQSPRGLQRLSVSLPNTTVFAASIMFIPQDFPLSPIFRETGLVKRARKCNFVV